jgi:hypothetical protein
VDDVSLGEVSDASPGASPRGRPDEPHNPFALADDGRWRATERARIAILLTLLVLAILALVDNRTLVFSTGSARTSAFAAVQARSLAVGAGCEDSTNESLPYVDLAGVAELRADIKGLIDQVPGRTYESGIATPQDMWNDGSPQRLAQARLGTGIWPASYEIRRFALDGDDIVADVFELTTPAQAKQLLAQASSARCHRDGQSSRASNPPQTRNLIWVNPDGFAQQDAFFARGNLVFRVVDVRAPRSDSSRAAQAREALAIVDRLACSLAHAGCGRRATSSRQLTAGGAGASLVMGL